MSDGEQFMNRPVPEHLAEKGFRPVRGASSFSQTRPAEVAPEGRDASPNPYSGATARVKARLEADDGNMARLFGIVPAPTVDDRREHDVIDQAIGAVVEKATHGRPSRTERDQAYLRQARESRVEAEAAQKAARREARWAKQEARDAKLRAWLEGKSDEEIQNLLGSESFNRLDDRQQSAIHAALDEIREGNVAEVDLALEEIDNESFEFAEADEDESTDLAWDDEDDDDDELDVLSDANYTERS